MSLGTVGPSPTNNNGYRFAPNYLRGPHHHATTPPTSLIKAEPPPVLSLRYCVKTQASCSSCITRPALVHADSEVHPGMWSNIPLAEARPTIQQTSLTAHQTKIELRNY
ncbi:Protein of unknown function [Pyronema omphalodes CBS 100304]|uniref:Uncharacterized protein n=1 Tax=Pyronema omphalodes (strain CBS 100304) TaxID=1076935 RepID=U4KYG6_PYROM|nr:Protein of unknown function [Pyronema omphalodes CBS 100304]